jgi:hypothetical protein
MTNAFHVDFFMRDTMVIDHVTKVTSYGHCYGMCDITVMGVQYWLMYHWWWLMEYNSWLMVHYSWPMHHDRRLMIYDWCTIKHDRCPMDYDVWPMINLRRWMINNWRSMNHDIVLFTSFFGNLLLLAF